MSEYFQAYRARLEKNHMYFKQMANEFVKKGYTVLYHGDQLVNYLIIHNSTHHVYFGFSEIPYRFYLSYALDPKALQGSGRTLENQYGTECTYTVDYIISKMQPNYKGQKFNNGFYIEHKIENHEN